MDTTKQPDTFSDISFGTFRENNIYLDKENILEVLTNDIITYFDEYTKHAIANGLTIGSEIKVGYIIYSKLVVSGGKIANLLNLLVQNKNPNIRIQSQWDIEGSTNTPIQTIRGIETKDVDKIKIKVIIRPNDKDLAIKKITGIAIENINKSSKKLQDYLIKYKTIIGVGDNK